MPDRPLRKPEIRALERLFVASLPGGACLVKSRAAVFATLGEMGLAERLTVDVPMWPTGTMAVTGWMLTLAGYMAYCAWADESCEETDGE
jgi:mannose/fructose/N-acetylgalactosamine-specific phosphotransferase system component IIC